jgi:hypothetical protein
VPQECGGVEALLGGRRVRHSSSSSTGEVNKALQSGGTCEIELRLLQYYKDERGGVGWGGCVGWYVHVGAGV